MTRDAKRSRVPRGRLAIALGLMVAAAGAIGLQLNTSATSADPIGITQTGGPAVTSSVPELAPEGRPSRGPQDAKLTVVQFTDFECQFCQTFARDTMGRLVDRYADRVRFVVRHFPAAVEVHPLARGAATAAECAHEQGAFWEYHDLLFSSDTSLAPAALKQHAMHLGLDTTKFARCLTGDVAASAVEADIAAGKAHLVQGTPTLFIGGDDVIILGAKPFDVVSEAIDKQLVALGA